MLNLSVSASLAASGVVPTLRPSKCYIRQSARKFGDRHAIWATELLAWGPVQAPVGRSKAAAAPRYGDRHDVKYGDRHDVRHTDRERCRGGDAGCPAPPSQIPAGGIPAPGSSCQFAHAYAHRLAQDRRKIQRPLAVSLSRLARPPFPSAFSAKARRKVCQSFSVILTVLVPCAGGIDMSAPSVAAGALALQRPIMSRSDSRMTRRDSLSLRRRSGLALAVRTAGVLRASSVWCVSFRARQALRPRQAGVALTHSATHRSAALDSDGRI